MYLKHILLILFFVINLTTYSQVDSIENDIIEFDVDTLDLHKEKLSDTSTLKKRKPGRAALYSAILPGLGQAYNNKYWKIPIVYSALGGVVFSFNLFNNQYKKYLDLYIDTLYPTTFEIRPINRDDDSPEVLKSYKDRYRRNRDLSGVIFLAVYLLNVVDATVDAHLSDFDVNEDLSLKIRPDILPLYGSNNYKSFAIRNRKTIGLTISLNF